MDTPEHHDATLDPADDGILRSKWLMDGATTLAEAAEKLEAAAATLREQHEQGWTLVEPIRDDYGFLRAP